MHPSPPAVAPRLCLVQPFPVILSSTTGALSPTLQLSFVAILAVTSLGVLFHLIRRYIVARERAAAERELLLAAERAARVEAEASQSQAEQARAEAEAANRAKDHFLALVSHELRSPLAGIRIWTKLLRRGTLGPQEAARALEVIERSTLLQMRLVADLLDVSRIVAGKLQLDYEDVDVAGTVRTALDLCRSSAGEKGVRLEEAFGPAVGLVSGDVARLQQVVWNLVANAIKFTPTGGRVEVRLERAHDALRLVVRDTGEGIAPALLPHVFEPFRQGDGTSTRRHGGLGLGLAIVRQLVHSHRGTVEAASAGTGQGATFTVTLPLKTGADAAVMPAEPERACYAVLDGVGVLVVDDDSGAREALAAALEQRGAELAQAAPPPVDTPA